MVQLTKRYPFCASHRLHSGELSEEENQRLFGKCNNPYGHGHNYFLEVSVRGASDPATGMVVRREELDRYVERRVVSKLDHANLNEDVPEFAGAVPTTENLAELIARWLRAGWNEQWGGGLQLAKVRVEETAKNSFEVEP